MLVAARSRQLNGKPLGGFTTKPLPQYKPYSDAKPMLASYQGDALSS